MNSVLPPSPLHFPPHETVLESLDRGARGASLIVVILGVLGVVGQILDLPILSSLLPDLPPMRGNTALCLVLLGLSLRLTLKKEISMPVRVMAGLFSGAACLLGLLTAFQFVGIYSSDLLREIAFWKNPATIAGDNIWGYMNSKTAGTIVLGSFALFCLDYESPARHRPAQWLAIAVMMSGFWTLLSYLFSAASPRESHLYDRAALNTALAFIVFGVGVLLARPDTGVMAIFSSNSAAGQMTRRILPAGILMLFVIGATTTLGLRTGLYGNALNNVLFTVGSIVLLTFLVWSNAHEIDKTEKDREQAVEVAKRQREWLHVMLSSIADAVIATDEKGRVQYLNPVAERITGWPEKEAISHPAANVFRLLNSKTGGTMECPTSRVLQHGEVTTHPELVTLIARDGRRVPIEDNGAPIRDGNGQLIGCVVVFRDVTDRRRADEMRQEVARQYATVAEAIPQMVWTAQADGAVDFFNQRWFEYTGLALEGSRGWLWQSAFHAEDRARCEEEWRQSIASGSRYEVEGRIRCNDGSHRWHLVRALPVIDREGRITKWFGTFTDIDDQKRAEEAMRFLADASTVLSTSMDEISTLQSVAELAVPKIADLCTVHLAVEETAGPGGLRRLQLAAVSHMDPKKVELMVEIDRRYPSTPERTKGVSNVLRTGMAELAPEIDDWLLDALSSNETHRQMLGDLGARSTMSVPLRGHREILGVVTFVSLESGRRFSKRDLSLAEEVARRTALALDNNRLLAEITATKVEAEAANAAKDQFLAVLSHELRTPLTPVLLAVEEMGRERALAPNVREVMEMTRRNIELEARLIDDLLDLTRIQRGKLELHRAAIDAHALLRSAIEICNADIQNKALCISLGLAAERHHVHADPARLQQVFWNLIKNSVKFTSSGGSIIFRSRNTPAGTLQIEVEDSGIGIDPAILPKIFNAFEQGEKSLGRRFGGLGLGLAITKNLVEAHGGSITVQSPGRDLGTKFVVELETIDPSAVPARSTLPSPGAPERPSGIRILLVEDNQDTGELLRKILERRGYQIDLATSVRSALANVDRTTFDLIVSDIGLPDGNGLELMQRIRSVRPIPGIAMSGFGMDEDIRRSREAGFSEHLTKPVSIVKLEEAIEKITRELPSSV